MQAAWTRRSSTPWSLVLGVGPALGSRRGSLLFFFPVLSWCLLGGPVIGPLTGDCYGSRGVPVGGARGQTGRNGQVRVRVSSNPRALQNTSGRDKIACRGNFHVAGRGYDEAVYPSNEICKVIRRASR